MQNQKQTKTLKDTKLTHTEMTDKQKQTILQSNPQSTGEKGEEIIRYQNYSIRKLTKAHKEKAMQLLIKQYVDQQPLSNGFCNQFPEKKKDLQQDWTNFYGAYIDYSIANGCGVAMFDLNNNQELVGVSITRDMTYVAQDFQKNILSSFNFGYANCIMQDLMIKNAQPEQQQALRTKGCVMNIWGVALKKQHMGKQLLHKMMLANEQLGKQQGFKYGYIYACNVKSGIAGKKIGYKKIGDYDCHQLIVDGKRPFILVDPGNQFSSIWLKKFE